MNTDRLPASPEREGQGDDSRAVRILRCCRPPLSQKLFHTRQKQNKAQNAAPLHPPRFRGRSPVATQSSLLTWPRIRFCGHHLAVGRNPVPFRQNRWYMGVPPQNGEIHRLCVMATSVGISGPPLWRFPNDSPPPTWRSSEAAGSENQAGRATATPPSPVLPSGAS